MKNLTLVIFLTLTSTSLMAQGGLFGSPPAPPGLGRFEEWVLQNTQPENFESIEGSGLSLRVSGEEGWLQSPNIHANFLLTGEFRFLEPESDSGIFLRVETGTDFIRGWPGDAYQVQIREISVNDSDRPLPLLNLYRHQVADGRTRYKRDRVFELYTGVGEWQQFEVILKDNFLTASLNGEIVLRATDIENTSGHIGFQSEKGVIEYRNLQLHAR